jgi:hypothetical protein
MKKLLFFLFCCICHSAFAQDPLYARKFAGNKNAVYITNSTSEDDLAFIYKTAKDTNNAVYLIENFKSVDIQLLPEKLKLYDAKIWMDNYTSKKGDLIFSFISESALTYFYHIADKISSQEKIN